MRVWHFFLRTFFSSTLLPAANDLLHEVRLLSTRGRIDEALSLFYNLSPPPPLPYSGQTYATLFHACACHGCLQQAISLHRHLLSYSRPENAGVFVINHLINMYAKCGDLQSAQQVFDEMPERNVVSWTALISGYSQRGESNESCCLFSDMLNDCVPNEFSFASVLSCCDFDFGTQVHALALKLGFNGSIYVANALISMYSKYNGDEAWTVFKNLKIRNLVSWNSMIAGFRGKKAVSLFKQMHSEGIRCDRATLLSVLSSLSEICTDNLDMGLNLCCQLHCISIKNGLLLQIQVATALVKAYSTSGEITDCYKLFNETSLRDIISWTGIITAFADTQPDKALLLYQLLNRQDVTPDLYTFSIVFKACAGLGSERYAMCVHSQAIKFGFDNDIVLGNAMIHAYARCGSLSLAKQVFHEMRVKNLVSWNTMLKAYAVHGQAKEALQLFSEMNVDPDSATMVALLSACSHAGMVEKGIGIFDSILEIYGISPKLDHYACMVDMLGRAGLVIEAKEIISKMPIKPDSVIWSALLSSCRKHGEKGLAEFAANKLKELDPGNSLSYVQMSNIYCSAGSYNSAGTIRKEMKGYKVRKEPGLSWIDIGNTVHEFASGGKLHPQRDAIFMRLDVLVRQLKGIGYVPETSAASLDIEEEHKEEQLYYHSEKLALTFAIMNGSNMGIVKIMKNIRICVDCHNFMKLASDFLKKEIVVRDSNRFHRFKHGICSCNDYW